MQNQLSRNVTQSVNQTQSLAAVQTLLRAGLGTITYLRNLLPEDNFTRSHFTSVDDSGAQCDASQESTTYRTSVSGFRITTITRGYTDEADRILNYMEYGIFDALEKRYLRSFIFGIYLDTKDPTNIVEAYTFNFKYHMIPGTDVFVPVMSLADKQRQNEVEDPVAKALKQGKPPTLKDVKMSVKALLKTLIQAISNMDVLPRRRFATFKVFYTEETPPDYEPPHFEPGDAEKDKWFFMTHDLDEVPERTSIGKINTGYHSVNLNVTSIASYLPSSEQADTGTFCGLTTHPGTSNLTPLEEAALYKFQAEKQLDDAKNRNFVWPVEDVIDPDDLDAEGEDDPDYIRLPDGRFERVESISLVGIRNESGTVKIYAAQEETEEAHFGGMSDKAPRYLHEMATENGATKNSDFEETQPLMLTPKQQAVSSVPTSNSVPNFTSDMSDLSSVPTTPMNEFDPELFKNMRIDTSGHRDIEMFDLETQLPLSETPQNAPKTYAKLSKVDQPGGVRTSHEQEDKRLQCECAIMVEDEVCYCEGGCQKWFHLWCVIYRERVARALTSYPRDIHRCMGYHSIADSRLPIKFICFDCRLRKDVHWELIRVDLYPRMMSKFKDVALFRRAIKVAQALKTFSSAEFSRELGGNVVSAGQMLKALEDQDYVLQESITLDDMGISVATRSKKGKNPKGALHKSKPRRNVQKRTYVFNQEIETKPCYLDYFSPDDGEVEGRLLGLSELVKPPNSKPLTETIVCDVNTQTQEETQHGFNRTPIENQITTKRTAESEESRPVKKLKMSVAAGVDLAE